MFYSKTMIYWKMFHGFLFIQTGDNAKFNTFLTNFRGQNMKIAGNLSFGKNISLVLLKNWLSFEFFRVFFALSFVKMLKKDA